jgi:hypothetical protein
MEILIMTKNSTAEASAAATLAQLPFPAYPCEDFAEAGLTTTYQDAEGVTLTGKPDFLACQPRSFTALEFKAGKLNHHLTHESSRAALQREYEAYTGRYSFDPLPHSVTSGYLHRRRPVACLDHGFNHALFKVLALQAEHGWQRYIVVFEKTPSKRDAMRYLEAGLVFCTLATLPDMLRTIELAQYDIFLPFMFQSTRVKYGFTVTPDHCDKGRSAESVRTSDRMKFESAVATYRTEAANPDPF